MLKWTDYLCGAVGPLIVTIMYLAGLIEPKPGNDWIYREVFPGVIVVLLISAFISRRKASTVESSHPIEAAKPTEAKKP